MSEKKIDDFLLANRLKGSLDWIKMKPEDTYIFSTDELFDLLGRILHEEKYRSYIVDEHLEYLGYDPKDVAERGSEFIKNLINPQNQ